MAQKWTHAKTGTHLRFSQLDYGDGQSCFFLYGHSVLGRQGLHSGSGDDFHWDLRGSGGRRIGEAHLAHAQTGSRDGSKGGGVTPTLGNHLPLSVNSNSFFSVVVIAPALLALSVPLLMLGCETESERRMDWVREGSDVSGAVVAVVDGHKIPAHLLETMSERNPTKTRAELLDDLIVASLLYEEAEAAGLTAGPEMSVLRKRLMVQRLLEDQIETPTRPETFPEAKVREIYDSTLFMYERPEVRTVDHLLVMPNSEQWDTSKGVVAPDEIVRLCDEYARRIRADIDAKGLALGTGEDLELLKTEWASLLPDKLALHVDLAMLTSRKTIGNPGTPFYYRALVEEFVVVAFELPLGVVSAPTRTQFGTHIMVVRDIQAAKVITFEEAERGIRNGMAFEARRKRVAELLAKLQAKVAPKVDLEAISRLSPDAGTTLP